MSESTHDDASEDISEDALEVSQQASESPVKGLTNASASKKQPANPIYANENTTASLRTHSPDVYKDFFGDVQRILVARAFDKHDFYSVLGRHLHSGASRPAVGVSTRSVSSPNEDQLEDDIRKLKQQVADQAAELLRLKTDACQYDTTIDTLNRSLAELHAKESLRHLLDRVGDAARAALLRDGILKTKFVENSTSPAYVLSMDLRRSTELMLKAREPKLYAEFITNLASRLRDVILDHHGIFDKFTGDGVLAFFPDFFSGKSAGLLAVDAAERCHDVFVDHYRASRHCFTSVLKNTGLGIGIDYGQVSIVQMQGEVTIVGTPVVYACRLGGAEAGTTLVNQPAYEILLSRFSEYIDFKETSLNIKHDGDMLAYEVARNEKMFAADEPDWLCEQEPT